MISDLASQEKVIGVKQSLKALRAGRVRQVFLACDADPAVTDPVRRECALIGVPVTEDCTMSRLGRSCGIAVGASAVALLKPGAPD